MDGIYDRGNKKSFRSQFTFLTPGQLYANSLVRPSFRKNNWISESQNQPLIIFPRNGGKFEASLTALSWRRK